MFDLNLILCMTKLRVPVLCFPYFTDNSIAFWVRGWGEREKSPSDLQKYQDKKACLKSIFDVVCGIIHLFARVHTKLSCCSPAERMGFPGHIYGIPKRQCIYHTHSIKKFSISLGQTFLRTCNFKAPYYVLDFKRNLQSLF